MCILWRSLQDKQTTKIPFHFRTRQSWFHLSYLQKAILREASTLLLTTPYQKRSWRWQTRKICKFKSQNYIKCIRINAILVLTIAAIFNRLSNTIFVWFIKHIYEVNIYQWQNLTWSVVNSHDICNLIFTLDLSWVGKHIFEF